MVLVTYIPFGTSIFGVRLFCWKAIKGFTVTQIPLEFQEKERELYAAALLGATCRHTTATAEISWRNIDKNLDMCITYLYNVKYRHKRQMCITAHAGPFFRRAYSELFVI